MGGHGGLNILPQKRWNVYNFDNREKVKNDEEAAAREEQLRLEQSRRAEAEFRLQSLRRARGIATVSDAVTKTAEVSTSKTVVAAPESESVPESDAGVEGLERDSGHINLFHKLDGFGFLGSDEHSQKRKAKREEVAGSHKKDHKRRREDKEKVKEAKVITAEEEKYRLGYGLAGKGVNKPWYLTKRDSYDELDGNKEARRVEGKSKKKSIEELREERRVRERAEKERERKLIASAGKKGFSR